MNEREQLLAEYRTLRLHLYEAKTKMKASHGKAFLAASEPYMKCLNALQDFCEKVENLFVAKRPATREMIANERAMFLARRRLQKALAKMKGVGGPD